MTSTEGQPIVQRGQLQPENIAEFINKIKASPWFKDTVIVVSSDHLAMNNTAWKYLNKQDRNNLFFVLRGDQPQQDTLAVKRNTMDNGATVLDILGGDNFIGLTQQLVERIRLGSVPEHQRKKMLAWKPDIIRLWNFPKEMKEFTVDRDKNMISFSGSHFRLPLLLRVSDKRVEPLPESEYSAPLRFQLADFAHAITSSGSIAATKWHNCGRRSWHSLPIGAYHRAAGRTANRTARR